jgi:hypothetical protein
MATFAIRGHKMSRFTVRVELRGNPTGDDYNVLHDAMKAEGFSRTIISEGTGVKLWLPNAEYNYNGERNKGQILSMVKRAAAKTDKGYSILVTVSSGRTWYNLEPAKN